ncbi:MAG: hypothetical protein EOM20_08275 [Spartobacteria bacterium]|nr:hypothetical protein [Spartobacteria bacterium]
MKCEDVKHEIDVWQGEEFPADLNAHIATCAECAAYWKTTAKMRGLIGLKRYEQPDPDFGRRNLAAVHERITRLAEGSASEDRVLYLTPAFRYALAALLLALIGGIIGLRVLSGDPEGGTPPPGLQLAEDTPAASGDALARTGTDGTNRSPDRIQYGTQPSKVVDYEY